MAATSRPTYNGLDTSCAGFAAAAAAALSDAEACPLAATTAACAQARLQPDTPVVQSGAMAPWRVASTSPLITWKPVAEGEVAGRPAVMQLGLESSDPPVFVSGPTFPEELRTLVSMQENQDCLR